MLLSTVGQKFSYSMNENQFILLEKNILRLVEEHRAMKKINEALSEEIDVLKLSLKSARQDYLKLKDENDGLKVANALLGNEEHRRLMKVRINKLIKELDVCMTQIKNEK